jgi:hypothetical protein
VRGDGKQLDSSGSSTMNSKDGIKEVSIDVTGVKVLTFDEGDNIAIPNAHLE